MKISIVTTALAPREHFLRRLHAQAYWIAQFEWVIAGPIELAPFASECGAKLVVSDEPIGTARNLCAEAATGDILIQYDDDDWQHPNRIAKQVRALNESHAGVRPEVVGTTWLYCLESARGVASRLSYWDSLHCLPGATLAYWRTAWQRHPFTPGMAEDGPFTQFFGSEGTCFDMHDPKLLVYLRHAEHTVEQKDWWRETRARERHLTAHEMMAARIKHPNRKVPLVEAETPRDLALAHEEEAATVYVRWLMGERDFDRFCLT